MTRSPSDTAVNEPAIETGGGLVPFPSSGAGTRLRLDIAYDGTEFAGWATQSGQRTVAGVIDEALSTVFRTPVVTRAAGRTDSGVHASGQVAHVDVPSAALPHAYPRTVRAGEAEFDPLVRRLGRMLTEDVRVRRITRAAPGFDARFSALRRHYTYRLTTARHGAEPHEARFVTAWPRPLDVAAMADAATELLGLHDFAAFCRRRDGATTIRELQRLAVVADGVCRERCGLQLQSLEAIRRATGGNQQRIRPLLLVLPGSGERQSQAGELDVERVWVSKASSDELSRMLGLPDRDLNDYSFVIDPMGALMMAHNHQLLESKQILGDMEKLLKVSQNWVKGTSYGHN